MHSLCSILACAVYTRTIRNDRYIEVTIIQSAGLIINNYVYCNYDLQVACVFVAALLHYLFTAVFFWMLCEGIMLYLMLVVVFSQISKKWWIFFIIGWGKLFHNSTLIKS